jgi:uncharacterized protein (DUF2267 family)
MPREKHFALKLTRGQLEAVQHLLEGAAAGASAAQLQELEAIDGRIYAILYSDLPRTKPPRNRLHALSLRSRGVLRIVRD